MARITIHPEHVEGLRYMVESKFESACDSENVDVLRELIPFADALGWDDEDPAPAEIQLSGELLAGLMEFAYRSGNEILGEILIDRAGAAQGGPYYAGNPERGERHARSMLAFHEHMQGQKVAS